METNKGQEKRSKPQETVYAGVNNNSDKDYERDNLNVIMTALDRHLNEHEYKFSVVRSKKFH